MNKGQLIEMLGMRLGMDKKAAAAAVDGMFDIIVRNVNQGENVTLTGFGVFEKRVRAARTARNPRTGQALRLKRTNVPNFRPGTLFKEVVDGTRKLPRVGAMPAATAKPAARPAAKPKAAATRTKAAATRSTATRTARTATTRTATTRTAAARTTTRSTSTAAKRPAATTRTAAAKKTTRAAAGKATAKASRPATKKAATVKKTATAKKAKPVAKKRAKK
ncbi:HU family DNA-binding protein [Kutzneria buriramensis]|uniref:DNA-binding protein HU-beta n=1 Tax=Kutzneria buriramensis TaxID=1045776 RepID=A0A3E0HIL7_9PSEU|nr:HU family DNA-binding protein [Kutzneria buriramensis]REH45895.1 DNA-binding protein HU-beta [Kutzneria buriramensis]